jgi:hypothetical protein
MVESLLVITIGLGVLCFRRLGALLGRDEASYAYLEARLEERIRTGMEEAAVRVQAETAASLTSFGDSLLARAAEDRLALERELEALARQVTQARQAAEERLDAVGREAAKDAQRTRQDLADTLESLHGALGASLREMRALHEQAIRELGRPIRQAVAIRQEIRRVRDQQGGQGPGVAGEEPTALEATTRGSAAAAAEAPDAPCVRPAPREEPIPPRGSAARRPRRLAELLGRVKPRSRPAVAAPAAREDARP